MPCSTQLARRCGACLHCSVCPPQAKELERLKKTPPPGACVLKVDDAGTRCPYACTHACARLSCEPPAPGWTFLTVTGATQARGTSRSLERTPLFTKVQPRTIHPPTQSVLVGAALGRAGADARRIAGETFVLRFRFPDAYPMTAPEVSHVPPGSGFAEAIVRPRPIAAELTSG